MKQNIRTLAPLAAGVLLAFGARAQEHEHHMPPQPAPEVSSPPATEHEHAPESRKKLAPKNETHVDHSAMGHAPVPPEEEVDHAAMGHGTTTPAQKPVDHSAMGHATPPAQEPVDHSAMGHDQATPAAEVDHAAMGHGASAPTQQPVDHSAMGHAPTSQQQVDHSAMGHAVPRAPDQPVTPIPVLTDEDRAAAEPPPDDHPVHDNSIRYRVLFNRLEAFDADEHSGMEWEGQAWFGTDLNKLWLRSEGERVGGRTESADLEVLYGRSIAPWWDLVAGVRHEFKPGDSQDFLAFGVSGLAPYKFEVDATAYLGQSGQSALRVEVEYELLLTNRLILQPLVELNANGQDDPERGIGSGVSTAEFGLRLRYEIRREIAPYVGIVHERAFGNTADYRRAEGEDVKDTRLVAGVRLWF